MTSERTGHWTKMCRPFVPFNGSATSRHTRFSAGFITATFGFRFSVHTPGLWASFHRAGQSHGYPRPANHSSVTMAKWHSGTFDRYVAPRVLGSNRDLWRGTFAADPFYLCGILQSSTPAHGITKGCAIAASCPHSIGGSSESGFAAVGPSGHTISPHPSSREGQHQSDRGTRPDDHVVVFGERHLREVLQSYANYYNQARTHLSLNKDAPVTRSIETDGRILAVPILGGLHRRDRQPRTIAA